MMNLFGIFLATLILMAGTATAETTLRVSVGNWEPYIGQDLPDEGMAAVILRESFANAGYEVELDFLPWKRAFGEAQEGHYDASYLWADREERRELFYYSIPVIVTTNVFFYRRNSNFDWDGYDDLGQYNIGGVLGYQYSKDWVDAVDSRKFHPIMINSDKIGFDMLKVGRLDAFPASYLVGLDILRSDFSEQQRQDILVHRRKITVHGLHLIVAKTIPNALEIVADFNRGYTRLAKDGRFRKIALQYLSLEKEENTSNVLPE